MSDLSPLDVEPGGPFLTSGERERLLTEALRDVQLGTHDARVIRWIARWESGTVRTIASLIERARAAAAVGAFVDCPACGARLDLVEPITEWTVTPPRGPAVTAPLDRPTSNNTVADLPHPPWCTRAETPLDGIHTSEPIDCNPGTEMVGVAVVKQAFWPPYNRLPPAVALLITTDGQTERYALPAEQASAVRDALDALLRGEDETP